MIEIKNLTTSTSLGTSSLATDSVYRQDGQTNTLNYKRTVAFLDSAESPAKPRRILLRTYIKNDTDRD
jgi:hypothetical protein